MIDVEEIKKKVSEMPAILASEYEKKESLAKDKIKLEYEIKQQEADKMWMDGIALDKLGMTRIKAKIRRDMKELYEQLKDIELEFITVDTKIKIFSEELNATKILAGILNTEMKLNF